MIEASKITVELATDGVVKETQYGDKIFWQGYLCYDHAPIVTISGSQSDGEYGPSISVSTDAEDPEDKVKLGYFALKSKVKQEKGKPDRTIHTGSNRKFAWLGIYCPLTGFISVKDTGSSVKFKLDEYFLEYVKSDKGIAGYVENGKEVPHYVLEDSTVDFSGLVEEFKELYPEYTTWHAEHFPTSKRTAIDNDKLARSKALLALAKKGSLAKELESVPF